MNWRNVRLIFAREIRDQLRDRRTLFMIAVLPMLLYPLLGMSVFQLSQFMRKHEASVLVIGAEQLDDLHDLPPLVVDGNFSSELVDDPEANDHLRLVLEPLPASAADSLESLARQRMESGGHDAVVYFPIGFGAQLSQLAEEIRRQRLAGAEPLTSAIDLELPQPEIVFNSPSDKSRVAQMRVERLLGRWRAQIARHNLRETRIPVNIARPFNIKSRDIAEQRQRDAVVWSKILPFVLFVWALTGAFYPSVDLCPGEKERGTLETLLSSPALRAEIVWGKLLTIMAFSIATALLNLASLGVTAQYVISQLRAMVDATGGSGLSFPPLASLLWLVAALVPMSALFSALCLACAAFARSTKEGQYYFMPLFMITMPLMVLPMSPGVELDLGNSLIPVTGVVLLLRALIEGHYAAVLPYVVPVVGMTALCCLLAIRWAIEQFQQESVLFRESERLDLRRWVVHLVRDRSETPLASQAFACVAFILVVQFFVKLAISTSTPMQADFAYFSLVVFVSQVVCILMPALLMTLFFTSRPARTLALSRWPGMATCTVAVVLAVVMHPVGQQLSIWISQLYPVSDDVVASSRMMVETLESAPYPWLPFVLIGLLPALCEELAFRGFILSGFRRLGHKWWAICLSAVFFGLAHTVLQQSLAAIVLGVVLGFIAIQSGSLIPCILFHLVYNSLMLLSARWQELAAEAASRVPAVQLFVQETAPGQWMYSPLTVTGCAILAGGLLWWLHRLPYQLTHEERLQQLRDRQQPQTAADLALESMAPAPPA